MRVSFSAVMLGLIVTIEMLWLCVAAVGISCDVADLQYDSAWSLFNDAPAVLPTVTTIACLFIASIMLFIYEVSSKRD